MADSVKTKNHSLIHQQQICEVKESNGSISDVSKQSEEIQNGATVAEPGSKKKTPMCLVNELARHHKLQPQYRLTDETGPPHQKTFTVTLKLGEEEYTASGPSIKKAQHATAQLALKDTKYPMPLPKPKPKITPGNLGTKCITPTVELNALAMKLGLPTHYENLPHVNNQPPNLPVNYHVGPRFVGGVPPPRDFRNFENGQMEGPAYNTSVQGQHPAFQPRFPRLHTRGQYYRYGMVPTLHRVSLTVGDVTVIGEGPTNQAARHNAAARALEEVSARKPSTPDTTSAGTFSISSNDNDEANKSPVSLVHELALKLNQNVEFTVLSESGPPHMKVFTIRCTLGDLKTEGEGNCKKLAKKKSAENMLAELKRVHPNGIAGNPNINANLAQQKTKPAAVRKKPRNLVKEVPATSSVSSSSSEAATVQDPISRLMQRQQARKEKEPTFEVISERGIPRQPEFVVQVTVGGIVAQGTGPKKKDAKKAAAQKALEMLGAAQCPADDKTTVNDIADKESPGIGRQTIPGLLVVSHAGTKPKSEETLPLQKAETKAPSTTPITPQFKESAPGMRPKAKLLYLARVVGFEVEFTDFPTKESNGEFLSLAIISSDPSCVCHGTGRSTEEAHDDVSSKVLQRLAECGLDSVAKKGETKK